MLMNIVSLGIPTMEDLMFDRFENIIQTLNTDPEFKKSIEKICDSFSIIKEKAPDIYKEAVLDKLDPAISCLERKIQESYYLQGLRDGLELTGLLKGGAR